MSRLNPRFVRFEFLGAAPRSLLVLGLSILAGLVAAWAACQHIQSHVARLEAEARTPVVSRVVAAHDLPPGTRLTVDNLATREFPVHLVPSDSIAPGRHEALLGQILRSGLRAGDLILPAHGQERVNEAFSAQLGKGRRAITMPVDAINSVSGLLKPGDLIDLYVSFEYQRRRITAPLLQGVLVLATGNQTLSQASEEGGGGYSTVTLDTSPEDAVKLVAARQAGTLTAVLRNPADSLPSRKAVRGDLASLLGVANPPPTRTASRAPVLYGNQQPRKVPRLVPDATSPRSPSGLFDLPGNQMLASAWLRHAITDLSPATPELLSLEAVE